MGYRVEDVVLKSKYNSYNYKLPKHKALIIIKLSRKEFKEQYTLKARIGIYIGVLIGLIKIEFYNI